MLKCTIIPAIIPQSLTHLRESLESLGSVASEIQVDIVDGVAVPYKSWPYLGSTMATGDAFDVSALRSVIPDGMTFELDLMIARPLNTLSAWLGQRPSRVVLHAEYFSDDEEIVRTVAVVREGNAHAIVAADNATPLERLMALIPQVDGVQCMGIAMIGRQGNPFDVRVLERIQKMRDAHATLSITVDGSVNAQTIPALREAGANRFVVGSGIFSTDNPAEAYRTLTALVV